MAGGAGTRQQSAVGGALRAPGAPKSALACGWRPAAAAHVDGHGRGGRSRCAYGTRLQMSAHVLKSSLLSDLLTFENFCSTPLLLV
jgi:hypothetical protein